jgi:hypothetical protein
VAQLLRGLVTGLVAFAVFCFAIAALLPREGVAVAFVAGSALALVVHGASRWVMTAAARLDVSRAGNTLPEQGG